MLCSGNPITFPKSLTHKVEQKKTLSMLKGLKLCFLITNSRVEGKEAEGNRD